MNRYGKLVVLAAHRVNYYKKYIYRTTKDYYLPFLGVCLKTRKPSVGQFNMWNDPKYMATKGKCIIESPKFLVRVM